MAVPFISERGRESSCVKVRPPRAVLVDDALVREPRAAELIQFRQSAHGHVLQNHGQQVADWAGSPED
jgi:hypothetical protein